MLKKHFSDLRGELLSSAVGLVWHNVVLCDITLDNNGTVVVVLKFLQSTLLALAVIFFAPAVKSLGIRFRNKIFKTNK